MRKLSKRSAGGLVTRLVEIGTSSLVSELGASGEAARSVMRGIAHALCREYGGAAIYIPKDDDFLRDARDEAIWLAFDGTNHLDLASKHNLTVTMIYKIIEVQRELHTRRNQPRLPGFEDPDAV